MIPAGTHVYVAKDPTDFRCSFDGLAARAMGVLGHDPNAGGMFVFFNRRGNQARVLFRDQHGWCILAKRLFRGRFRPVDIAEGQSCKLIDGQALVAILDAIVLGKEKKQTNNSSAGHLCVVKH